MNKHISIIATPVGTIKITSTDDELIGAEFLANTKKSTPTNDPISQKTKSQIIAYFKNPNHVFDLPIKMNGTIFQKKVWRELQKIPAGKTLTYGELAKKLKTSPRAIGNACRANPLPIIIPCHRIISQKGLSGFAGKQTGRLINIKKFLLSHENSKRPLS